LTGGDWRQPPAAGLVIIYGPPDILLTWQMLQIVERRLASQPLTAGLPVLVAMTETVTPKTLSLLDETEDALNAAGMSVQTVCLPRDAQRLRQMALGSTTTSLLRMGGVPVLVLR